MIANERSDARGLKDIDPPAEKRFTPIIGLKGIIWLNLIIRARSIKVNREKVTPGFPVRMGDRSKYHKPKRRDVFIVYGGL